MAKPRQKTAKTEAVKETPAPAKPAPRPAPSGQSGRNTAPLADPALDAFTAGCEALNQKDYARAAGLFERSLADSDRPELSARARQYLVVARQQASGSENSGKDGKDKKGRSDEDAYLQAVVDKNRGDLEAALESCREGGRDQKDERFAYLAASIHAVENRLDEAVQTLNRAIELNPKNRVHAFHDPDFAELRRDKDHRQLFGLS